MKGIWANRSTSADDCTQIPRVVVGFDQGTIISQDHSRSPWASPIVAIVEKAGVDIRLCIGYRLVNNPI
ncbi:Reverse transcriptase [Phytophthora palmivora]|uniref:Reverse transcriptase n=1 Tax=Phytophthora palmivora TaxID=4796 RepID=A0A2P4XFV2_9STRA|nr:Reverse transcriptase [Phytophthora palmivora]